MLVDLAELTGFSTRSTEDQTDALVDRRSDRLLDARQQGLSGTRPTTRRTEISKLDVSLAEPGLAAGGHGRTVRSGLQFYRVQQEKNTEAAKEGEVAYSDAFRWPRGKFGGMLTSLGGQMGGFAGARA